MIEFGDFDQTLSFLLKEVNGEINDRGKYKALRIKAKFVAVMSTSRDSESVFAKEVANALWLMWINKILIPFVVRCLVYHIFHIKVDLHHL